MPSALNTFTRLIKTSALSIDTALNNKKIAPAFLSNRRYRINQRCVMLIGALSILSGCANIGPKSIQADRADYNMAIQHSNDQELLLNIVRAHYRDNIYFLTVERIAASQQLQESMSASFSVNSVSRMLQNSDSAVLGLGPASISVNENPTIFYAPIEGEKFARQMMKPMNLEVLALLVSSGTSIDRIFSVALRSINGLNNAPTASGPTPSYAPEFKPFQEVVRLLRVLQRERHLDIVPNKGENSVDLVLSDDQVQSKTAIQLKQLLKIDPSLKRIPLYGAPHQPDGKSIVLTTRSLIAALNYLSQGVEVPVEEVQAGKVRTTVQHDGKTPFDWQDLLGGIFKVQSSRKAPASASVSIYYRGLWFYIADNDLDSKSTFVLLDQLISLHSTPPQTDSNLSYAVGK